ncbi:unnamed protein product [Brassica rapa]|uniref:Uncharacterized protein n=1 Tax=Brassica campestris TaxID=3711 RepID=A0A8D9G761_BRACM|nr:unnamed protein product [Brassica rapa]
MDTHGHTRTATDVLCVLTDTHGHTHEHTRTAMDVLCVLTDSHRQRQTSCVCWRTPTEVLCVLNRQPTWAKITQTIHGKGQHAESKDQRADMCTDGQPQASCDTPRHTWTDTDVLCVLVDAHGRPVTNVLICVLMDSHRRLVCADGHTGTAPDILCVLTDTHGLPVCADGYRQTSYSPRGPKSPEQSRGRVSMLSPRTNVLICVLMDSHGRPVLTDGQTRTHTDSHGHPVHGRPVCAGRHPRTSSPTWAKITQTVHEKGQRAKSKDQRADMYTDEQPRTSCTPTNVLCVRTDTYEHTWTVTDVLGVLTDNHRQPRTSCVCWRTPTDVLCTLTDVMCVLTDTHGCPEQTAHVGRNDPNSPRDGPAC